MNIIFTLFVNVLIASLPQEVEQLLSQSQEQVWPGLNYRDVPTVLVIDEKELYIFENGKIERRTEIPADVANTPLHPNFEFEGKSVFLFHGKFNDSAKVYAHERFHRYQFDHFEETDVMVYQDQHNEMNLAWMQVEEEALLDFLTNRNEQALRDFAAAYKERMRWIKPSSKSWEDHQQRMEGLADYVGFKLSNREHELLDKLRPQGALAERALKWRHYGVGAAIGIGLDFLQVKNWKMDVQNGENLVDVFLKNIKPTAIEDVKMRYRFVEKQNEVKQVLKEYQDNINSILTDYKKQNGTPILLGRPPQLGITGGGESHCLFTLDRGVMLSVQDHANSNTSDNAWRLSTHTLSHIFQHDNGVREFKVEQDLTLKIDGVPYQLSQLIQSKSEYPFKTLEWKGSGCSFVSITHPGKIKSPDGKALRIRYDK